MASYCDTMCVYGSHGTNRCLWHGSYAPLFHAGTKEKLDEEPKFRILYNRLVKICDKWKCLAINLGLEAEIARIDGTGNKMEDKLFDVLTKWRKRNTTEEPYTWRTMITALQQPSLGEHSLAEEIRAEVGKWFLYNEWAWSNSLKWAWWQLICICKQ